MGFPGTGRERDDRRVLVHRETQLSWSTGTGTNAGPDGATDWVKTSGLYRLVFSCAVMQASGTHNAITIRVQTGQPLVAISRNTGTRRTIAAAGATFMTWTKGPAVAQGDLATFESPDIELHADEFLATQRLGGGTSFAFRAVSTGGSGSGSGNTTGWWLVPVTG